MYIHKNIFIYVLTHIYINEKINYSDLLVYEDEGADEVWQPGGEQHHRHHQQVGGPPRLADREIISTFQLPFVGCEILFHFVSFFVFLHRCRRMTA